MHNNFGRVHLGGRSTSEARATVRAFALLEDTILYIAYLDEFGHIGPFIHRTDPHHKTSPVFGLGGFVLPASEVRSFGTWFYKLKCSLLDFEIKRANEPAYRWEKKGSALFTTTNVEKYPELRRATFRILNRIKKDGGFVFYVGIEKSHSPEQHNSKRLFKSVLREAIKRLDQQCVFEKSNFLLFLDETEEHVFRPEIVAEASIQMFQEERFSMIEPPIQAESHLFQTLQCADWICGLVGRQTCFDSLPDQYPELEWTKKYFSDRIKSVSVRSGIRKPRVKE